MDSAEAERLSEVLRTQEVRLNRQEEFQTAMAANMGQLSSQIQKLLGQLCRQSPATPTPPSPATPEVPASSGGASCKLAPPIPYAGEPGLCQTFLIDCSIHFELMPQAFPTERAKVAFMMGSKLHCMRDHYRLPDGANQNFCPCLLQQRKGLGTQHPEARERLGLQLCVHSRSAGAARLAHQSGCTHRPRYSYG